VDAGRVGGVDSESARDASGQCEAQGLEAQEGGREAKTQNKGLRLCQDWWNLPKLRNQSEAAMIQLTPWLWVRGSSVLEIRIENHETYILTPVGQESPPPTSQFAVKVQLSTESHPLEIFVGTQPQCLNLANSIEEAINRGHKPTP